jgi:hypothetical protein
MYLSLVFPSLPPFFLPFSIYLGQVLQCRDQKHKELIKALRRLEKTPPGFLSLKPGTWALLWLSDMEKLDSA